MPGIINNFANTVISLNQEAAPYFGIGRLENGQNKVWLTNKQWCAVIPEGLTDAEASIVSDALDKKILVVGRTYLPAKRKDPAALNKYVELVKRMFNPTKDARDQFVNLVINKYDGNYTAFEIISECLKHSESLRRDVWTAFLKEGLGAYIGPQTIVEDYSDSSESQIGYIAPEVTIKPIPATKPIPPSSKSDITKQKMPSEKKEELLKKMLGDAI